MKKKKNPPKPPTERHRTQIGFDDVEEFADLHRRPMRAMLHDAGAIPNSDHRRRSSLSYLYGLLVCLFVYR